jgi:hypothetical protein
MFDKDLGLSIEEEFTLRMVMALAPIPAEKIAEMTAGDSFPSLDEIAAASRDASIAAGRAYLQNLAERKCAQLSSEV